MSQSTTTIADGPSGGKKPLVVLPPRRGFGQTSRKDAWWVTPLLVFIGLGTFVVYSTWAAFQGNYYRSDSLLSPFYSPEIFGPGGLLGPKPTWWPTWLPFSPALFILWGPAGFRLTCYYYRGAYYKAFWADPSSCAIGEPRKSYWGENSFPLIMQNLHRYFVYLAVVFLCFLAYDVWDSLWVHTAGKTSFGITLGTLILALNVVLLSLYTFGCHSLRHIFGGRKDEISKSPTCHKAYSCVSCLNKKHMLFAWCSLFTVGFSDLYVRMCAMGIWHDWRIL